MDDVANFRDFGGKAVRGGGALKPGRLFRSGALERASAADLDALASLKLGAIADLRRETERLGAPNRLPLTFDGRTFVNPDPSLEEAPHIAFLREAVEQPASLDGMIERYYRTMPHDPGLAHAIRLVLAYLTRSQAPLLIHCSAGKDRTGFVVALLLEALGVDHELIIEDYLRSSELSDGARFDQLMEGVERAVGGRVPAATVRRMFGVEADWLGYALDEVAQRFGSGRAYLSRLGLGDAEFRRIHGTLVKSD